jgi:hypothetical protein
MAPSRQERRKAERDAAKRAPAKSGAGGAGGAAGAAAALANLNVNPLGDDWTTQAADPYVGPGRHCLARHVPRCPLPVETSVQSAVTHVASDICMARPLGAVRCARRRGGEAEGRHGGRGSAVHRGLPVSESSGWECGLAAGRERPIAHGGCRVGTSHLHVSSRSPDIGASRRPSVAPSDQMLCLRSPP